MQDDITSGMISAPSIGGYPGDMPWDGVLLKTRRRGAALMKSDEGLCCAALLWRGPGQRSAQSATAGSSQGGGRDKAHAAVHVHAEGAHVRRHDPATARCTLQVNMGSLCHAKRT